MKSIHSLLLLLVSTSFGSGSSPARALTVGPMLHWNFGGGEVLFSWGAEVAYWQTFVDRSQHLHGVDVGIEFEGRTRRLYAEYQYGGMVYGGSVGPLVEFSSNQTKFGLQGSVWGSLFMGGDLRIRHVFDRGQIVSPGLFLKLPIDLNNGDYGVSGN